MGFTYHLPAAAAHEPAARRRASRAHQRHTRARARGAAAGWTRPPGRDSWRSPSHSSRGSLTARSRRSRGSRGLPSVPPRRRRTPRCVTARRRARPCDEAAPRARHAPSGAPRSSATALATRLCWRWRQSSSWLRCSDLWAARLAQAALSAEKVCGANGGGCMRSGCCGARM